MSGVWEEVSLAFKTKKRILATPFLVGKGKIDWNSLPPKPTVSSIPRAHSCQAYSLKIKESQSAIISRKKTAIRLWGHLETTMVLGFSDVWEENSKPGVHKCNMDCWPFCTHEDPTALTNSKGRCNGRKFSLGGAGRILLWYLKIAAYSELSVWKVWSLSEKKVDFQATPRT